MIRILLALLICTCFQNKPATRKSIPKHICNSDTKTTPISKTTKRPAKKISAEQLLHCKTNDLRNTLLKRSRPPERDETLDIKRSTNTKLPHYFENLLNINIPDITEALKKDPYLQGYKLKL